MSGMFRVKLLRAATVDGQRFLAGAELAVEAPAARALIASGIALLVNDEDLHKLVRVNGSGGPHGSRHTR